MEYIDFYDQKYLEIAHREDKIVCVRIEALDHTEYVVYDMTDDIIDGSDNISITYGQGVQSKLSFDIFNDGNKYTPDENSPFWYGNKIKIYYGLKDIITGDVFYFTKGVYVVTNVSTNENIVSISAVDKFGQYTSETGSSCLDTTTRIDVGTKFVQMISDIFAMGMGNGKVIDPSPIIADEIVRDIEIGEDIEIGTSSYIGDLFLDIANSLKCRIFYNPRGNLILSQTAIEESYQYKAPVWTFDDENSAEMINMSIDYDFPSVKNKVTVWGESFDGISYVSTVVNDNPNSPVRVSKVGFRVANTIENMYGYNQENVDAFAKMYLNTKSIVGLSINVDCSLLPHISVEDVVAITSKKNGLDNQRFLVSGVTYNGDKMTISLTNIDLLPQYNEMS